MTSNEALLPEPNPSRGSGTGRFTAPLILLGLLAALGLWVQNSSWAFLHPVRTHELMEAAAVELQTNWLVRNDGIARNPFPRAVNADEWAKLNARAAIWFAEEQRRRQGVDLEQDPNTYWRIVLLDAQRRDSIKDVILQVTVRVEGIDCYVRKLNEANCPGYPSSTVDTQVRLTMKQFDGEWAIAAVQPILHRSKRPTDPMLWLCLADGDPAGCGRQLFSGSAALDS